MLSRLNQPITLKRPSLPAVNRGSARPRRSRRELVGLDIEPGQIVAAQVRVNGGIRVERAAGMPLSPDVVRDGEVSDGETLTAALKELFATTKLSRRVRIGIANQRIVVRKLELPPITDPKDLANAVRFQAQDEIPMPLDSVVTDFHALGVADTPAGPRQHVVLVAARREMVERVVHAVRAAGLRPEGVDLSAFAMIRALRPVEAPAGERVLYLAVGGLTNLAVADGPICQFTRVIGGGVEQIVAEVAARCGVAIPEARRLLSRAGVEEQALSEPLTLADAEVREPAAAEDEVGVARSVLREGIRRVAAEVRNSLDFHGSQTPGPDVSRVVLCGPATDIAGFDATLATELGLPVACGGVERTDDGTGDSVPASRLTVAAGLAVERGAP